MIKFAIIGCGHIAKKHIAALEKIKDAQLVSVCDKIPANLHPYEEQLGVRGYTSLDEMFEEEDIDVVNICTPSGTHKNIAIQAASREKHVIVEKPMALHMEDADAIIEACEQHNVKLAVVHPNRFRPVMVETKRLIEEGRLGKLSHVNATLRWNRNQAYYDQAAWRGTKEHDGGVLMNQAIHNLDLMLWFTGQVQEVYSMEATRFRDIEAEDVSTGVIRFEDGTLGVVEAASTIFPANLEETISIFGENGTIKVGGKTASYFDHLDIASLGEEEIAQITDRVKADPLGKPGQQGIIEDMVKSIKKNETPIVDGYEGRKALELVTSMYQSAEEKRPVQVNKQEKGQAYVNHI
ncbi:Gfo/Idh/MocA family protein [Salibacterium halotolerans]|uniref:Predicted dehydrogenase n=1 Tax=Salibacterium halotolerans TaxID=1884432 RepID=A0A1I5XW35_9BACI|nr:Gfo/Idh/MocA family oxidoreductase [Salibacterium halotolerans]SFQ36192.1 Predicted dehydrogenase [Salibacterium halotolerans]